MSKVQIHIHRHGAKDAGNEVDPEVVDIIEAIKRYAQRLNPRSGRSATKSALADLAQAVDRAEGLI